MNKQARERRYVLIVTVAVSVLWTGGCILAGLRPDEAVASGLVWVCFGMMARDVT